MSKKNSAEAATPIPNGIPTASNPPSKAQKLSTGVTQEPTAPKKKKKDKLPQPDSNNPPSSSGQATNPPTPTTTDEAKKKKKKKKTTTAEKASPPASVAVPAPNPKPKTKTKPTTQSFAPPPRPQSPSAPRVVKTPGSPASTATLPVSGTSTLASSASSPKPVSKGPPSREHDLLDGQVKEDATSHQIVTAPLITRDAFVYGDGLSNSVRQYGVIGSIVSIHSQGSIEPYDDKRVYLNTNAPFSAVVCGVQGSGKSHTVGVLLESMLIPNDPRLGVLPKPLSALVLHFGEGGAGAQPCEAAHQCLTRDPHIKPPRVTVFVSPNQYTTMKKLYQSHFKDKVQVLPLKINHAELDAKSILSMMSVSANTEPPLYVHIILNILRELGETFTYTKFKLKLAEKAEGFNPAQKAMCEQRLSLLESFLEVGVGRPRFKAGEVTIVDLTDPFISSAGACSLFEIITTIFIRADVQGGKVLVVDEAHKYLKKDQGSEVLTETLLSIVRQQRHLGIRLILSTQEPTVIPEALLDLCSVTIMHRFSSITWFDHLAKHVSSEFGDEAFDTVVKLETGQALVLAPSGLGVFQNSGKKPERGFFGRRYLIVKTRQRVTADGGASILAVA
ncbi:hypothetical protein FRB90_007377 [Tulasnella sp. 427]|nr:hypothetical protein FRB90_007377 [Tulasnella sp. 427]